MGLISLTWSVHPTAWSICTTKVYDMHEKLLMAQEIIIIPYILIGIVKKLAKYDKNKAYVRWL